ncbi:hypothetical protein E8E13_005602 [Curvularia kusanoi]|uniref:Protein kinase domain-containing protein n=1 Tax=Curvularia kusanoi TaxID=90978 RepID=A0A9P4T911_CURKU|nr:hypothetical protein E8E13_005602 [Curvularia kusanoi]
MKKGMTDKDLPIRKKVMEWDRRSWRVFYKKQWKFFAPIFNTSVPFHEFGKDYILPILSKERISRDGATAQVSRCQIHKNHIQPALPDHVLVAVKKFESERDKLHLTARDTQNLTARWDKEITALRAINDLGQDHIVRFITAFRRTSLYEAREHCIMLEWADGGNLGDLMRRIPHPDLSSSLLRDAVKQILGLATALSAVHNLSDGKADCYHGNLKPENILVFSRANSSLGTFKISDWVNAIYQGPQPDIQTVPDLRNDRYEAPEMMTGSRRIFDMSLCDIWSMGCITFEFVIWLLYGKDGLENFREDVKESFYVVRAYAQVLGDGNFPHVLYKSRYPDKIKHIQEIYKKYTKSALANATDRPIAIEGLQQRILQRWRDVDGDFGIFDDGIGRGILCLTLLWRRHADQPVMSRIDFSKSSTNMAIPSWSWMAYMGRIDFYDEIGCDTCVWNTVGSPWAPNGNGLEIDSASEIAEMVLSARGRTHDFTAANADEVDLRFDMFDFDFDAQDPPLPSGSLCVVLGIAKGTGKESERLNCVLIVAPASEQYDTTVYERIGVGLLPAKCLGPESAQIRIV